MRWDPPARLEMRHRSFVLGLGTWQLQPVRGGTRLTWTEDLCLPVPFLGELALLAYRPFLRRLMRRGLSRPSATGRRDVGPQVRKVGARVREVSTLVGAEQRSDPLGDRGERPGRTGRRRVPHIVLGRGDRLDEGPVRGPDRSSLDLVGSDVTVLAAPRCMVVEPVAVSGLGPACPRRPVVRLGRARQASPSPAPPRTRGAGRGPSPTMRRRPSCRVGRTRRPPAVRGDPRRRRVAPRGDGSRRPGRSLVRIVAG